MNKDIIQFWSGGADSTYLLLQNLKAGHKVTAVYIDIGNNNEKTDREHLAMERLKGDISVFCKHYNLEEPVYTKPSYVSIYHPFNKTYCYPQDMMFSMFCTLVENEYSEIHFGKVLEDHDLDAKLQFFNDVMKANASFIQSFEEKESSEGSNASYPKIVFPIRDVSKLVIYSMLSTYDKILDTKFINNITVCENPGIEDRCGKCEPCQKQKEIISELNLNFKYNDISISDSKIKECDVPRAGVELISEVT